MAKKRQELITQKGPMIYKKIIKSLRDKYPPTYYIAIEPTTEEYFVAPDSISAAKLARKKYPRRTFFGAHIGWMTGKL